MIKLKDILTEAPITFKGRASVNPMKVHGAFKKVTKEIHKSVRQLSDEEFFDLKKGLRLWLKKNIRGEGKLK
jgi:hypothetical protein